MPPKRAVRGVASRGRGSHSGSRAPPALNPPPVANDGGGLVGGVPRNPVANVNPVVANEDRLRALVDKLNTA